jgi:hypothetical protein
MNDTAAPTQDKEPPRDPDHADPKRKGENSSLPKTRFEKFASTQAAGDGIEGEVLKPGKTIDEKIGANMADRK